MVSQSLSTGVMSLSKIPTSFRAAGIAILALPLGACSLSGQARPTFDQVALNQTWYGAYHRPLPVAEPRTEREPREPREPRDRGANSTAAATAIPDAAAQDYSPEHAAAYVRDVYSLNETPIGSRETDNVVDVYRFVSENGTIYHDPRPAVGDLAFFHNTFDSNSDRRPNDWYTHVGIVESVTEENTVTVLSFVDGEVGRLYLNLENPSDESRGRATVNTPLRQTRRDDPEHTQYLAGELFAGFGSLLGERTQVIVLDDWHPSGSPSLQASR
ncbi:MAG: hypothetical protein ACJAYU_004381 [Bradymonadia bacterium]|jgi:hypothetical protein